MAETIQRPVAERLLARRRGKLPPAKPASSEVVSNNCPELKFSPKSMVSNRCRLRLGQAWSNWAFFRPTLESARHLGSADARRCEDAKGPADAQRHRRCRKMRRRLKMRLPEDASSDVVQRICVFRRLRIFKNRQTSSRLQTSPDVFTKSARLRSFFLNQDGAHNANLADVGQSSVDVGQSSVDSRETSASLTRSAKTRSRSAKLGQCWLGFTHTQPNVDKSARIRRSWADAWPRSNCWTTAGQPLGNLEACRDCPR